MFAFSVPWNIFICSTYYMRFCDETRKPERQQGGGKIVLPAKYAKRREKNLCPRMTLIFANRTDAVFISEHSRYSRANNFRVFSRISRAKILFASFRVFRGQILLSVVCRGQTIVLPLRTWRALRETDFTQSSRSSQSKTINPPSASQESNNSARNPRPLLRAALSRFCNRLPGYASGRPGCDIDTGRGDARAYR